MEELVFVGVAVYPLGKSRPCVVHYGSSKAITASSIQDLAWKCRELGPGWRRKITYACPKGVFMDENNQPLKLEEFHSPTAFEMVMREMFQFYPSNRPKLF